MSSLRCRRHPPAGLPHRPPSLQPGCVFCEIAQGTHPETRIIYETEHVVVFPDIHSAAAGGAHYQVVPKQHMPSLHSLSGARPQDVALGEYWVA